MPHANAVRYVLLAIITGIKFLFHWVVFLTRYKQTVKAVDEKWKEIDTIQSRQLEIQGIVFRYRKLPTYASTFRSLQAQFGKTYFATRETNAFAVHSKRLGQGLRGELKVEQTATITYHGTTPIVTINDFNADLPNGALSYQLQGGLRGKTFGPGMGNLNNIDNFSIGGSNNFQNNNPSNNSNNFVLNSGLQELSLRSDVNGNYVSNNDGFNGIEYSEYINQHNNQHNNRNNIEFLPLPLDQTLTPSNEPNLPYNP